MPGKGRALRFRRPLLAFDYCFYGDTNSVGNQIAGIALCAINSGQRRRTNSFQQRAKPLEAVSKLVSSLKTFE
jgi:hypothetical protein